MASPVRHPPREARSRAKPGPASSKTAREVGSTGSRRSFVTHTKASASRSPGDARSEIHTRREAFRSRRGGKRCVLCVVCASSRSRGERPSEDHDSV